MDNSRSAEQLIDVNDSNELSAWKTSLGVTEEELQSAVAQVGNSTNKVVPYLRRNKLVQAETARRDAQWSGN